MKQLIALLLLLCGLSAAPAALAIAPADATTQRLYEAILHREPDAGGLVFWRGESQRLANHAVADFAIAHVVAEALFSSAEYAASGRDDAAYVSDLYAAFLGRAPDAEGLAFWVARLQALPREALRAAFIASDEHRNFSARTYRLSLFPPMDFLVEAGRALNGAAPDEASFAAWAVVLAPSSLRTCTDVFYGDVPGWLVGLQALPSAQARAASDADFVVNLYAGLLQRDPDEAGFAYWTRELPRKGRAEMVAGLMASPEFQARLWRLATYTCPLPPPPGG
jgi:hypothetical protein